LTRFITEMIPLLHLKSSHAEPIRYIVSELVRNVIEHAASPHGAFVAAQYYAKSNSIRIGISDVGVGVKKTINRSHSTSSDLEAIQLALMPGVTGTTRREGGTEQNAGAGLFFIKSIASVNGDFFAIYSGNGFYKLLKQHNKKRHILHADPFKDRHSSGNDFPAWPGTAVGIDMKLDENETFSALLDHIRETYGRAVRERRRIRYKKPQFV
ncbi:MAG: ATP-binding protein, partial [bacterium]|nr:ATP-binding protein [bacterium]